MGEQLQVTGKPIIGPYSGPNGTIWATRPAMRTLANQTFNGRVVIEVFEKEVEVVVIGGDRSLISRAGAVLRGSYTPLRGAALPWTSDPVTGKGRNEAFLGRVVIELWNKGAVVGITGSDAQVVARAMQQLGPNGPA